jgi:hypothetical protein
LPAFRSAAVSSFRAQQIARFKDGYADGCASAQQQGADFRGRLVRDDAQYNSDQTYRTGWGSGYQTCRPIQHSPDTTPGSNPLPQPIPN